MFTYHEFKKTCFFNFQRGWNRNKVETLLCKLMRDKLVYIYTNKIFL